jgi:hypothetical protein
MTEVLRVLGACRVVSGHLIKLPDEQLAPDLYADVKARLLGIGGKWRGGRTQAFAYPADPTELLARLQAGEDVNLRRDFQFIETPDDLADELVGMECPEDADCRICDPQAGRGALVRAVLRNYPYIEKVDCFEMMPQNRVYLEREPGANIIGHDFLQAGKLRYDLIYANPPFSDDQDIDHIYKMYWSLFHGGVLCTIASQAWMRGSNQKQKDFKKWLAQRGTVFPLPKDAFKQSKTMVSACRIFLRREERTQPACQPNQTHSHQTQPAQQSLLF